MVTVKNVDVKSKKIASSTRLIDRRSDRRPTVPFKLFSNKKCSKYARCTHDVATRLKPFVGLSRWYARFFGTVRKKKLFSLFLGHSLGHNFFLFNLTEISGVVSLNFLNLNQIICDFNIFRKQQNQLEISVKNFCISDGLLGQ